MELLGWKGRYGPTYKYETKLSLGAQSFPASLEEVV